MSKIIKRNGNIVEFDRDKIINAINKAFIEADGELYEDETEYAPSGCITFSTIHQAKGMEFALF